MYLGVNDVIPTVLTLLSVPVQNSVAENSFQFNGQDISSIFRFLRLNDTAYTRTITKFTNLRMQAPLKWVRNGFLARRRSAYTSFA